MYKAEHWRFSAWMLVSCFLSKCSLYCDALPLGNDAPSISTVDHSEIETDSALPTHLRDLSSTMREDILQAIVEEYPDGGSINREEFVHDFCYVQMNPLTFRFRYFANSSTTSTLLCVMQPYRTSTWFVEPCDTKCFQELALE